jgi:predicted HAD superfamily Cof-like phosphohydrolase
MSMPLDVLVFQTACDQKPSKENVELYRKLINEEYGEFVEAYQDKNEVEQLDACMDLIWVTLGFCNMKGYDVQGAWNEVLRSNMRKLDPKTQKAIRREDGKILKPEGWTPPNLKPYVI